MEPIQIIFAIFVGLIAIIVFLYYLKILFQLSLEVKPLSEKIAVFGLMLVLSIGFLFCTFQLNKIFLNKLNPYYSELKYEQ